MKLLAPTTLPESGSPPPGVDVVWYDPHEPLPRAHHDATALVAWGNPRPRLAQAARDLTRLRWVQSLAAGMTGILECGFSPDVVLTSGRGLHDGPVAEHALALILCAARRLHDMRDAQARSEWADHLGGIQPIAPENAFTTLRDAHVTILGFGSIAARLAPSLQHLGARVTGVATREGPRHGVEVIALDDMIDVLPSTDALVCLLPSTSDTRGVVNAATMDRLPNHAWLVNLGRGDTIIEDDLTEALRARRLAGAALDVFSTEPLPPTSPLWSLPQVIVSPHAAGGRPIGGWSLIERNAQRLLAGEALINVVDRQRGY